MHYGLRLTPTRLEQFMSVVLYENFRALFYAPFYAAHAIGAYAAEGADVTLRASPDPASSAAALGAGAADVMWGGPLRVLLTHAKDPTSDVVCFCDVVKRDPFFIVGRTPKLDFQLGDLLDLRFASVAEVPTPWLCLQDDLRRAGVDPAALSRISGPSMADNAAALRAGTLDAAQLFQPHTEALLASGAGHLWYAAASRGPTAYTALIARRSVIAARREELLAMVRAMRRTLQWIAATSAADIAHALREFFPAVSQDLFAGAIARYQALDLYATDPVMPRAGFERLKAAMLSGGALRADIAFDDCVDTTLAQQDDGGPTAISRQ
jgi:NitT/TauT family transport system substrate-binding protein